MTTLLRKCRLRWRLLFVEDLYLASRTRVTSDVKVDMGILVFMHMHTQLFAGRSVSECGAWASHPLSECPFSLGASRLTLLERLLTIMTKSKRDAMV